MKILLLAPQPFYQVRGTPIAVRLVAESLAKSGRTLTLLTYPEGEDIAIDRCRIVRLPSIPGVRGLRPGFSWKKVLYDVLLLWKAAGIVRRERPDLVHAVEESAFVAVALQAFGGVPFVYDMDSSIAQQMLEKHPRLAPLSRIFDRAERFAIRRSVGVIVVCRALEDVVARHDPAKRTGRIEDISLIPFADGPAAIPDEHRLTVGGPVVLYAGNLEPYQGFDLLLEGFHIATRSVVDLQLVVVGGAEADIRAARRKADALGAGARVHLLGPRPVDALPALFAQADVLVSPRIRGRNTPMKIYSYLASGKAVLATRIESHTQVLDDAIACLVEPDADALAAGLVRLVRDRALRESLGEAGRRRAEADHSRPAFERKLLRFYEEVEAELGTR